jgi:hypothetical protein
MLAQLPPYLGKGDTLTHFVHYIRNIQRDLKNIMKEWGLGGSHLQSWLLGGWDQEDWSSSSARTNNSQQPISKTQQNGLEVWLKQYSACFMISKPWVQTPVPSKEKQFKIINKTHFWLGCKVKDLSFIDEGKRKWEAFEESSLWTFTRGFFLVFFQSDNGA